MEFKEEFKDLLNKYSFNYDNAIIDKFEIFYNLLIKTNKQFNLTAITNQTDVIVKHFIDSLLAADFISDNSYLIDIGSGAGLPALPLAFVKNLRVVAVDSVNKKVNFINEVAKETQLQNFKAIHSRIEQIAHQSTYREMFDTVTCRAVAKLNTLCEYSLPFLKIGGIMIAYKGKEVDSELNDASRAISLLGGKLLKVNNYNLEGMDRSLIIIKKIKPTPAHYPRAGNKPRTNPIV